MLKKIYNKLFGTTNMRLSHIVQKVYCSPMLVTPQAHTAIRQVIESKLAGEHVSAIEDKEEDTDLFGEPLPVPYDYAEGVRAIPITGVIGYKVSMLEKTCGVVDVRDLTEWVEAAEQDPNINTILFDISSPGGSVTGVPELATYILNCKKKTVAFTDDLMASAAYWIGCACDQVFATPSSEVGSVGVYMYLLDVSKAYEEAGVKPELFVGGNAKYKAMGLPGLPLTDTQRSYLQQSVDELAGQFKAWVKDNRGYVEDEAMQGQTLMGEQALQAKLVDAVVYRLPNVFGK